MIPKDKKQYKTEILGKVGEAQSFMISQEGIGRLVKMSYKGLYSDAIMSFMREYYSNAIDSHVEAGAERPIEVTLPNPLAPVWKIRDFGVGLDEEGFKSTFCSHAESTKRHSDDLIGAKGIGSKSGFAYVDSFIVTCWKGGVKRIFVCSQNDSGLGEWRKLSEVATDEPDGVQVEIAIEEDDIDRTVEKFEKFCGYLPPDFQPEVSGHAGFEPRKPDYLFKGDGWGVVDGRSRLVSGPVAYPLNASRLNGVDGQMYRLASNGVHLFTPIGEVEVTHNREELDYTRRTSTVAKWNLRKVLRDLKRQVESERLEAEDGYAARLMLAEYYKKNPKGKFLSNVFGKKVNMTAYTKTGQRVDSPVISLDGGCVSFRRYWSEWSSRSANGRVVRKESTHNMHITKKTQLLFNDTRAQNINKKVGFWVEQNKSRDHMGREVRKTVIEICGDEEALQNFLTDFDIPEKYVLRVSEIKLPSISSSGGGRYFGTDPHAEVRRKTKAFVLDFDNVPDDAKGQTKLSSAWKPTEIDLDEGEGYYVKLNRFKPLDSLCSRDYSAFDWLRDKVEELSSVGFDAPIYGVRGGFDDGKFGPGWERIDNLSEFVNQRFKQYGRDNMESLCKALTWQKAPGYLQSWARENVSLPVGLQLTEAVETLRDAQACAKHESMTVIHKITRLGVEVTHEDFEWVWDAVGEEHPILSLISDWDLNSRDAREKVAAYLREQGVVKKFSVAI